MKYPTQAFHTLNTQPSIFVAGNNTCPCSITHFPQNYPSDKKLLTISYPMLITLHLPNQSHFCNYSTNFSKPTHPTNPLNFPVQNIIKHFHVQPLNNNNYAYIYIYFIFFRTPVLFAIYTKYNEQMGGYKNGRGGRELSSAHPYGGDSRPGVLMGEILQTKAYN
jgi:hypothetical protein